MVIAPETDIWLLNSPLTEDQNHQLTFNNVTAQQEYFAGLGGLEAENCTYQRKDQAIRFPAGIDSIRKYNYVRYQNSGYSNKWFYAFITRMEYVNDEVTLVYIKTDVYQTWMFNFNVNSCYVEREHVNDDTIGKHTYPEGLEYGPYIINKIQELKLLDTSHCGYCMQVTDFPSNSGVSVAPQPVYNGVPSGCYYLWWTTANSGLKDWINAYTADGKKDAILSIFPLPVEFLSPAAVNKLENNIFQNTYIVPSSGTTLNIKGSDGAGISIGLPTGFGGYAPRNNKLFTDPYCYFYYDNHVGSTVEYRFENFTSTPNFYIKGAITQGAEYKIVPSNLIGGNDAGFSYGCALPGLPLGSWNTDAYNNWKALNSGAMTISATADLARAASGAVTSIISGNLAGLAETAISTYEKTAMRQNQVTLAKKLPDQAAGNVATQALTFGADKSDGAFYTMTIKAEYAKIIDDFFSTYGYKVNEVKIPNITGRQNWNYVKTLEANLTGNLPQDDLEELKRIFDKGITFWHNPQTFLQYSAPNAII